jgi:hypothetical protein
MLRGIFARGATNINTMESQYRLNPALVAFLITLALLFQSITLIIVYLIGATLTAVLIILILMAAGDLCIIGVSIYMSRLYLREEMIDMAMLFANYNPNILREGGTLINSSYDALKMAKREMTDEMKLKLELEQLLSEMKDKDSDDDFVPLVS